MSEIATISLAVIAIVYVVIAIGVLVGIVVLIKMYSNIRNKLEFLEKQIEPYQSRVDFMVYKMQQVVEIMEQLAKDAKELSEDVKITTKEVLDKTKDTTFEIMDKTKESVVEVNSLVVGTKKRVENHTSYVFDRIKALEEKLDDVYAFLAGLSKVANKLIRKGD